MKTIFPIDEKMIENVIFFIIFAVIWVAGIHFGHQLVDLMEHFLIPVGIIMAIAVGIAIVLMIHYALSALGF